MLYAATHLLLRIGNRLVVAQMNHQLFSDVSDRTAIVSSSGVTTNANCMSCI
jgi:hypothetical protein